MFKGGALFYVLVISFLLLIGSSSLIFFYYSNIVQFEYYQLNNRLKVNAHSGMELLMSDEFNTTPGRIHIDLYDRQSDSVELQKRQWGLWDVCMSKAYYRSVSYQLFAMVGYKMNEPVGLYIEDHGKPIYVSGKTVLKGTCYIPKIGVQEAHIEGKHFEGDRYIYGEKRQSEEDIPAMTSYLYNRLNMDSVDLVNDSTVTELRDSIHNSFYNRTVYIHQSNTIDIGKNVLIGNIKIESDKRIVIRSDASLENVILIAPIIEIEESFKGSFQAFASDSIIVGEKSYLKYPSALVVTANRTNPKILIKQNASVEGVIIAYNPLSSTSEIMVNIQEGFKMKGMIYCNAMVDVKGKIEGSLFCSGITLRTKSSTYVNHLLETEIAPGKLYTGIAFPKILSQQKQWGVAAWVN